MLLNRNKMQAVELALEEKSWDRLQTFGQEVDEKTNIVGLEFRVCDRFHHN